MRDNGNIERQMGGGASMNCERREVSKGRRGKTENEQYIHIKKRSADETREIHVHLDAQIMKRTGVLLRRPLEGGPRMRHSDTQTPHSRPPLCPCQGLFPFIRLTKNVLTAFVALLDGSIVVNA